MNSVPIPDDTRSFSLEGERVEKILNKFGMSTESLSQSGLTSLKTLSEVRASMSLVHVNGLSHE